MKRSQFRGITQITSRRPFQLKQGLRNFLSLPITLGALSLFFSGAIQAANPSPTPFLDGRPPDEIGPHHRSWKIAGSGSEEANHIAEIATGMNFWNGQEWSPSDPSFSVEQDAFVATRVQHKSRISSNLNTKRAVTIITPDGITLSSTPVAIALYDAASGQFAVIGTLTNCVGSLVSSNEVVFENAFSGVCASVFYRLEQGSFEQDVVFTGRFDPTDYGFPTNTTRIQIITEFYDGQSPHQIRRPVYVEKDARVRSQRVSPDLMDEKLGFGEFVLGTGHAFTTPSAAHTNGTWAIVAKEFMTVDGRTFVFESVPYASIREGLNALPECDPATGGQARINRKAAGRTGYASIPTPPPTPGGQKPNEIAGQTPGVATKPKGVVIDYIATLGGTITSGMLFQSSTNYFVSGAVYCNGSATIEGGTIFKYKVGAFIQFNGTLTCNASMYRPIVFTAVDDDTVGDTLNGWPNSGYTGRINPSGYANPAISCTASLNLNNCRFRYAATAVQNNLPNNVTITINHSQFLNCVQGIFLAATGGSGSCPGTGSAVVLKINNSLFSSVSRPFTLSDFDDCTCLIANCTLDHSTQIISGSCSYTVNSSNSIYASVSSLGFSIAGNRNGFFNSTHFGTSQFVVSSSPFQTNGAGYYYLTDASGFRTNGSSSGLSSSLVADLKKRTTSPPLVMAQATIITNLTFSPQTPRDTNCNALGYHYDPLDYALGWILVTNATVTITNGAAVATFGTNAGTYGLAIGQNARLQSIGAPNNPNWIVQYNTVQEEPITNWFRTSFGSVASEFQGLSPGSTIACRFTDWSILSLDAPQFYAATNTGPVNFQDCEFHGGKLLSLRPTINLTNDLLERVYTDIRPGDGLTSYVRNCLVFGGNFSFAPTNSLIADNLFDKATITNLIGGLGYSYSGGFNAYVTTNYGRLFPAASGDIILTNSPNYQVGKLGNYYQLTNSTLINADTNTTANQVGLYHYTVMTNFVGGLQIKETNSFVDLGYHYVATDTNGIPIDTNGDGIPDYLSDSNGNGVHDPGEINWFYVMSIKFSGTNVNYIVGASPISVDSGASVIDTNCANFSSGTLKISIITNVQPEDTLAINNQGTNATQIGVSGSNVTYSGTVIGSVSGGLGSTNLAIALNSSCSLAALTNLLQNVTYHYYPSTNESIARRTVQFVLNDCNHETNIPVTKTISLACPTALNVMLVIDCSGSMTQPAGGSLSKIQAAQGAAISFVSSLQSGDQVGLVTFADSSTNNVGLTNNFGYVTNLIGLISANNGNTDMGDGVMTAQGDFPTNGVSTNTLPIMILLTDGVPNRPTGTDPTNYVIVQAALAKQAGTRLITIGLGTAGPDFNPALLQTLASAPDDYHYASNTTILQPIYTSIAQSLCRQTLTNQGPSVTFINPTNSQLFVLSPTNILLSVSVTNTSGTVTNVAFFNGSTKLGQTNAAPWQFLWTNVVAGTYTLTAQATNSLGGTGSATVTNIVVNAMPTISIAPPTNHQTYLEVTNVTITATAADSDGKVTNVQFFAYSPEPTNSLGNISANSTNVVCSVTWSNRYPGDYPVVAVATDNRGASTFSAIRVFKVLPTNPPPTVLITYPTNNSVFADGVTLTVTATATNWPASVTNVQFFVNGVSIGSDPSAPYAVTKCCWKAGHYVIVAKATDTFGAVGISPPVTNTIVNDLAGGVGFWDPLFHTTNSAPTYPNYITADECGSYLDLYWSRAVAVYGSAFYLVGDDLTWPCQTPCGAEDYVASSLRKWDGTNWYRWGGPSNSGLSSCRNPPFIRFDGVAVDDSGIYVNGVKTNSSDYVVFALNGTTWTQLGGTFQQDTFVIDYSDTRTSSTHPKLQIIGGDLFLYGNFTYNPNTNIQYIAKWNAGSGQWQQVGPLLNAPVYAVTGLRGNLIIGGLFTAAGGNTNANHIAKLAGASWTNLGFGVGGVDWNLQSATNFDCGVFSLATCDTNLYVGGDFTYAGNQTNANGIAIWNDLEWKTIGRGLFNQPIAGSFAGNEQTTNPIVFSISAHGKTVYVAGAFSDAVNSDGSDVSVASIVKGTWNEEAQQWRWSAMDIGVYMYLVNGQPFPGVIDATAILDGSVPGAYDVMVAGPSFGEFYYAGAVQNYLPALARWRVGYPQPPSMPSVTITNPPNLTLYTNTPTDVLIVASAASNYTNIDHVDFYVDGIYQATDSTQDTNVFYFDWFPSSGFTGPHTLTAVAIDAAKLRGSSSPVLINIFDPSNTVTAVDDKYVFMVGDPPATLNVLANDNSSIGKRLRVVQVYQLGTGVGTAQVSFDANSVIYTPNPNTYGTDFLLYSVTDGVSTNTANVVVKVRASPFIVFQNPTDGMKVPASSAVGVNGVMFDYDTTITNFSLFVNGQRLQQFAPTNFNYRTNPTTFFFPFNDGAVSPQSTYAYFTNNNWSTNVAGYYTFVASATDTYGYTNSSTPVTVVVTNSSTATNILTAAILNLPTSINPGLGTETFTVVNQGLFDVNGIALDSNTNDAVAYELLVHPPGDLETIIANVTPQPRDVIGFHWGRQTNDLGIADFSGIPNGVYDLELVVHGGGASTNAVVTFQLDTQLKIGQFSFSEQDAVLPVNGIPITITRTYSSMNPLTSDFGYSWSLAINSMDVQLDEVRIPVQIGDNTFNYDDSGEDDNGLPKVVSVRSGGGRNVTLTLPSGRRTTFAFTPYGPGADLIGAAAWTATAPGVLDKLTVSPSSAGNFSLVSFAPPKVQWDIGGENSTFENCDMPGWNLQTVDGTVYQIRRGPGSYVVYDNPDNPGQSISARVYGPPALSAIVQRSGDSIVITTNSISHQTTNGVTTRSLYMGRDDQGRITAIYDPNGGTNGFPTVQYVYNQDTGNLIQVLKLVDRTAGIYVTNKYHHDNPNFPHYITSIENANGVPVARNYYDDSGRLTAVIDADNNRTEFDHSTTNNTERIIDRLGHTNTLAYDARGNVIASTNALNAVVAFGYDDNNNKTQEIQFFNGQPYATNSFSYDPSTGRLLTRTNGLGGARSYTYGQYGQRLISTDELNHASTNQYDLNTGNLLGVSDAMGTSASNSFDSSGLLQGTTDALGISTTNYHDNIGNLTAYATLSAAGMILRTNTFGYDADGQRTNITVWRKVNAAWVASTTSFIYDGQGHIVQTIDPDGGTNVVAYDDIGNVASSTDKLGRVTKYTYDFQGRLLQTTYPDLTTEISSYDAMGNRTNSIDRAGRATAYVFDALGRQTHTIWPDGTADQTIYDDLNRVRLTIDPRGITNAFGYDAAGRCVAVTNAWGTPASTTTFHGFDARGNLIYSTNALGRVTTNIFDPLNRQIQVLFPDGTRISKGYDALGRRVAETNQDLIVTRFGFDGVGRLIAVTNAFGKPEQAITHYDFDEAGNLIHQIDPLNRTNTFAYDSMGRRVSHTRPGRQIESFGYDAAGSLIYETNFDAKVITNSYDVMKRLTNRTSANAYSVSFAYSPTDQRTRMTDSNGTTSYSYNERDRLTNKVVSWTGGPNIALNYRYDESGNLTNLSSSSPGGVTNSYQYDSLNRLTNVFADGLAAAGYSFDAAGNLQTIRYVNGVTNLFQYDLLNRLTNAVWKTNAGPIASFYYQLGLSGIHTNLSETLNGSSGSYAWSYDSLYRLKQESLGGASSGAISYAFDSVGNRTNRTVTGSLSLTNQSFTFNTNDWLTTDSYDDNGNTTNSSGNAYRYDPLNNVTNVNNGAALLTYDGDGNRLKKTVGSATTYYVLDDRNPSGYVQVLEEWTASSGATNLTRVHNYGLQLISQRTPTPTPSTNYFIFDGHGSTRLLTDNAGNVANAFSFDAYGNLIRSNAAPQTSYLYCGQEWDTDLGMYHNRARYYSTGLGRFWTADSHEGEATDPPSLHKYSYCQGDPVNRVDPSGHDGFLVCDVLQAASVEALYISKVGLALEDTSSFNGFDLTQSVDFDEDDDEELIQLQEASVQLCLMTAMNQLRRGLAELNDADAAAWDAIYAVWDLDVEIIEDIIDSVSYVQACFPGDTPVVVGVNPDGSYATKPIASLRSGDYVLTRPEAAPGSIAHFGQVEKAFRREVDQLRILTVRTDGGDQAPIRTTSDHPFWVANGGWTSAERLLTGDRLLDVWGKESVLVVSNTIENLQQRAFVYNITVGADHTYFVADDIGAGRLAAWVHNACKNTVNLNNNKATSKFGVYEFKVIKNGEVTLEKVGKADLNRVTKSSGFPTRIHQQVRKLELKYGKANVLKPTWRDLGQTTSKAAKAAETARLDHIYNTRNGFIPKGNEKSYFGPK